MKTAPFDSIAMDQEQRTKGIGHRSCTNLNYTVFASDEGAKTTLVLTANDRQVSHIMLESDNKLIKKVWNNLTSTPNFGKFAIQIISAYDKNKRNAQIVDPYAQNSIIANAIRYYSNNGTSTIKYIILLQTQ